MLFAKDLAVTTAGIHVISNDTMVGVMQWAEPMNKVGVIGLARGAWLAVNVYCFGHPVVVRHL